LFSKDNPFVFGKQDKFRNIDFTYITLFCCADDVQFYKCKFKEVNLIGKKGVAVSDCDTEGAVFIDFTTVRFFSGNLKRSAIISNKTMNIYLGANKLSNIDVNPLAELIWFENYV